MIRKQAPNRSITLGDRWKDSPPKERKVAVQNGDLFLFIGKFAGRKVSDIDDLGYLEWFLSAIPLDDDARKILEVRIGKLRGQKTGGKPRRRRGHRGKGRQRRSRGGGKREAEENPLKGVIRHNGYWV